MQSVLGQQMIFNFKRTIVPFMREKLCSREPWIILLNCINDVIFEFWHIVNDVIFISDVIFEWCHLLMIPFSAWCQLIKMHPYKEHVTPIMSFSTHRIWDPQWTAGSFPGEVPLYSLAVLSWCWGWVGVVGCGGLGGALSCTMKRRESVFHGTL